MRLHADHVDQEAQRTQVVGQAVEGAGFDRALGIDLGIGQRVDVVTHAQHGLRGLIQAQHRQHAAHRRQLGRHRDQTLALRRIAEVLVDVLFDLRQRGAQLLHHAAHGLAIRDAAVQLFHPQLKRAGIALLAHGVYALRQPLHALCALGMVKVTVIDRGVEVEQRGGHFHRQRRRWLAAQRRGMRRGHLQGATQHRAVCIEPSQRIADQGKLLGQALQPRAVAAGHRRPDFLGRRYPLARLRHPGRIKAAQPGLFVIDLAIGRQAIALPHHRQPRASCRPRRRLRLAAEEQQILGQPLRGLGHLAGTQLRQQLRTQPLAVGVGHQEAVGLAFKKCARQLPQRGHAAVGRGGRHRPAGVALGGFSARLGAGGQTGQRLAHARRHRGRCTAHQCQQIGLDLAGGRSIGMARRHLAIERQLAPGPGLLPHVSRVDAAGARQLLQRPVLREQRQGRHRLAGQPPVDQFKQRKRGALEHTNADGRDQSGPRAELEQGGLGGAQQIGGGAEAHQFEHTHALVQLRTCLAQHGRVDRVELGQLGRLFQVAIERLVGQLQRAAQLIVHPGQRTEVAVGRGRSQGLAVDRCQVRAHAACHARNAVIRS